MKGGFLEELHTVVYCDCCGDVYSEDGGEGICFDSIAQAVDYINARSAAVGWFYDGDRVICDACRAIERDETNHNDPTRGIES
ncbi:hypothetical protein AB0C34_30920 [Nocardia sp. NPDC049220]|uniref:hypothetical protein n=1 Tax=Nocardia sp. NPDC049220 TaxID=3155273 RepID=UPI0033CA87E1